MINAIANMIIGAGLCVVLACLVMVIYRMISFALNLWRSR